MSIVKDAFDKHARTVKRGFKKDREKTVGASEIGLCARRTWYAKHSADYDEDYADGWGAAKRGSVFETRFFVPAMRKHYGSKLLFTGGNQERYVHKTLSATPDALLIDQPRDLLANLMVPDIGPSKCVVIDCKTIDPRINLSDPKPEHVFQIIVQLGLVRMKTKYKPDYGVLVYTNASFFDDTVEFVVPYNDAIFEQAKRRANQIIISSTANDLKPEGWIAGGNECKYCPYARACAELRGDVPDAAKKDSKVDPQVLAELIDLAHDERKFREASDSYKASQLEVQEKIKQRLKEKGLIGIKSREINITWFVVKGRLSYDMPAIKAAAAAAGVDLQQYETVGERTDRLLITVKKQDRLVEPKFPTKL